MGSRAGYNVEKESVGLTGELLVLIWISLLWFLVGDTEWPA